MAINEDVMREALKDAGVVLAEYIHPRSQQEEQRDAGKTVNRLIAILDNQNVASAVWGADEMEPTLVPQQLSLGLSPEPVKEVI